MPQRLVQYSMYVMRTLCSNLARRMHVRQSKHLARHFLGHSSYITEILLY